MFVFVLNGRDIIYININSLGRAYIPFRDLPAFEFLHIRYHFHDTLRNTTVFF